MNNCTQHMSDSQKISEIIRMRSLLNDAEEEKCMCSGFVIQYEGGCQCKAGRNKKKAKKELIEFIESV